MNKIMILGTFHMESQNNVRNCKDLFKLVGRDDEFEDITDRLKKYNPTKIALETEKSLSKVLNDEYNKYLNGEISSYHERVQLGFRLAEKLNLAKLYAVDWMGRGSALRGCADVIDYLNNKEVVLKEEITKYEGYQVSLDKPILENLVILNSKEETEKSKAYYANYARIGVNEYYGIGWLTWWYERNLKIFANLSELISDSEDERILLIIGGAHKGILEEIISNSKMFEIINVHDYLK